MRRAGKEVEAMESGAQMRVQVKPVSWCTFQAGHAESGICSAELDLSTLPQEAGEIRVPTVFFVHFDVEM